MDTNQGLATLVKKSNDKKFEFIINEANLLKGLYGLKGISTESDYKWYELYKKIEHDISIKPLISIDSIWKSDTASVSFTKGIRNAEEEIFITAGAFQPIVFNNPDVVNSVSDALKKNIKVNIYNGPNIVTFENKNRFADMLEIYLKEGLTNLSVYKCDERPYFHCRIIDDKEISFERPHEEIDIYRTKYLYIDRTNKTISNAISKIKGALQDTLGNMTKVNSMEKFPRLKFDDMVETRKKNNKLFDII